MNNVEFFFRLATSKAVAKLQAAGYDRDQIAEYLTRPGHLASLIEHAKELHFQMIEHVEQNFDAFAAQVRAA